jgi:hypothetical protein
MRRNFVFRGRRAECGCSFGPGVVRNAICSTVRLGGRGGFVQFIVSMDRIEFCCAEMEGNKKRKCDSGFARAGRVDFSFGLPENIH